MPIPLLELAAHDCRFPVAEDEHHRHLFCGAPAKDTLPYCAEHCKRCYGGWHHKSENGRPANWSLPHR